MKLLFLRSSTTFLLGLGLLLVGSGCHAATCGNGNDGDGECSDGSCCSEYGWCGRSPEHCKDYCGGGDRGNGRCTDGLCCSEHGWCGSTPEYCDDDGPNNPVPAPTPVSNPSPVGPPIGAPPGDGKPRMLAYVGNWEACPSDAQIAQYSHIMIAFAVTYQWTPSGNACDATCQIATPPLCDNQQRPDLIQKWQSMGKKIILSFGGAGMGGSWLAAPNGCWESCFGRETQVVNQLVDIVNTLGLDGVDIDYEYYYENNQGFSKGAEAQTFLTDVTLGLRAALPDKELLHVPMEPDLVPGTGYYNVLQNVAGALDYLMPQYYNGYIHPANNMQGALSHYANLLQLFDGDATKIVFGFCIKDCGGFNLNANQAATVMRQLSQAYPCNGGAFFWVASDDPGGSWSSQVNQEIAIDAAKCDDADSPVATPTDAPVAPTDPPVDPTEAPVAPTNPPVTPTDVPVAPTDPPVDPTEAPVAPTNPPIELPVAPTAAPVGPTEPDSCTDKSLPGNWGANGFYGCDYYENQNYGTGPSSYCANPGIADNCCYCGGGDQNSSPVAPTDPPVSPPVAPTEPTAPDSCTDKDLPGNWGANGLYGCDFYENHNSGTGPSSYCANLDIGDNCCYCGGGDTNSSPEAPVPAPTTSAPTTAAPVECIDDPDFRWKDKPNFDCDWVAKKLERCDKPRIAEACKVTCNTDGCTSAPTSAPTMDCTDDPNFQFRNKKNKNCAWAAKKPGKRCKRTAFKRACPATCNPECDV